MSDGWLRHVRRTAGQLRRLYRARGLRDGLFSYFAFFRPDGWEERLGRLQLAGRRFVARGLDWVAVDEIALRGEYLYAAEGAGGLRVYDVASVANKGVSQRIVSAPFSPLGHDTHVASKAAACVALPTNQPINPARNEGVLMREVNQEQPFHPIYHYAVVADAVEGLILVNVDTLADGEPRPVVHQRAAHLLEPPGMGGRVGDGQLALGVGPVVEADRDPGQVLPHDHRVLEELPFFGLGQGAVERVARSEQVSGRLHHLGPVLPGDHGTFAWPRES